MSYCLNPNCPNPNQPQNIPDRICRHCDWEILLPGRYRILRLLGESASSKTFEVQDGEMLKVLKVLLNCDRQSVRLFQQEARVLSQLQHPGIPKIYSQGYYTILSKNSQEYLLYLAIEKIDGLNLEEWLKQRNNQPISQNHAINWLKQLVNILDQVHQQKYFHQAIKPSNVILRPNGQLVLINFDNARKISDNYTAKVRGKENPHSMMSEGYMPLEQIKGKPVPQSDFFALGRTLVYLLTGKSPNSFPARPYAGELFWRTSANQISKQLADLLDRLMSPLPENRPANTQIILQDITKIEAEISAEKTKKLSENNRIKLADRSILLPLHLIQIQTLKNQNFSKLVNQILAVSSILILGFTANEIYDYWQERYDDRSYNWNQKTIERPQIANAAENLYGREISNSLFGYLSRVNALAFSPDGEMLAIGSGDDTIKLWYLKKGKNIQIFWWNNLSGVNAIAFSPNGQTIASASTDNTIKLWNVSTGELRHTLQGHAGWVSSVAFSPDGQTIASGSDDNTIKLWNATDGQLQGTLRGHTDWVSSVAFSPNGKTLASGSFDNTIKLWNPVTGELQSTLISNSLRVRSIAFSPDGKMLASGTGEGTIELWNLITGKLEKTLPGHEKAITAIAFSPDGQKIASSGDSVVKIWGTKTGFLLENISGHLDTVDAIAFNPRHPILATGSDDKTIKIWPIEKNIVSNYSTTRWFSYSLDRLH